MRRAVLVLVSAVICALISPLAAGAHVERPSYWPDPKADCGVSPCAGGRVPAVRSLASALDARRPGTTRVVCQGDSLRRVERSIRAARKHGYDIRPTDHRRLGAARAHTLLRINRALFRQCAYHQVQAAVTASHNDDRVVVMPGVYREQHSRHQPTHDPACRPYRTQSDGGDPGALTHDYQVRCPNDANLVAVIGRSLDTAAPPDPPRLNRHGIPNVGACIRCNLQLEGSGVSADDVVIEAGSAAAGNGGPSGVGHKKDVGLFVDRADGFVLRNITVRHAAEHDIYVLETDGYRLDRFKTFYAGGYGVLTFAEDHGLVQNCDAAGNGDSGLYPGSGADTTDHRYRPFYPAYRFSQVFRNCDSHHNDGGFSGTNSHGTLITHNNFYDNALGFTTDVFTASGHPGFPQHGNVIRDNNFYSNNFNPFRAGSDVRPFIASPVGTGLWLAGGNDNIVQGNHFFNNWRRGLMLFAVPDATVCGPAPVGTPVPGCDPAKTSTSYGNRFFANTMGVSPTGKVAPNGTDFWWDDFPGNTGNCWWGNKAAPGVGVTTSPPLLPNCQSGTAPATSVGTGDPVNEGELVGCLAGFEVSGYPAGNGQTCTWATTPPKPGSGPALRASAARSLVSAQQNQLVSICLAGLSPRLCAAYGATPAALPGANAFRWPGQVRDRILPVVAAHSRTSRRPLGTYTCSWWRQSDRVERLGMVQRIRNYDTLPINGDDAPYGYGAGMSDSRAMRLLSSRCSTTEAGAFALYKIYGAAAPFAALVD